MASAQEIFGAPTPSAREIFGAPAPKRSSRGSFFKNFKRKEGPKVLNIRSRDCKDCGGVTTSITRYMCAACHFRGWWPEGEA